MIKNHKKLLDNILLKSEEDHKYIIDHARGGRPLFDVINYAAVPYFNLKLNTGASIIYSKPILKESNHIMDVFLVDAEDNICIFAVLIRNWGQIGYAWNVITTNGSDEETQKLLKHAVITYIGIQNIFLNRPEAIIKDTEPKTFKVTKMYKNKYREVKETRIFRYYSLNQETVRKHFIVCDCWGVAGHWRHYKNGKKVFISPYKKGINRDKKDPANKTYLFSNLTPKGEDNIKKGGN